MHCEQPTSLPMSILQAEELASLIKDNLSCKHLVLSAEETFVSFLNPEQRLSIGNVLMLEPMVSYHRMLLHRLADMFKLGHESVGEGSERRLMLEVCEDSCIPDVLVSDILDNDYDDNHESIPFQSVPQLLKRTNVSDGLRYTQMQSPPLSLEEREAAYLAARERIFQDDVCKSPSKATPSRPRSVPVVAQRMIAHALGKRVVAEQSPKVASPTNTTAGKDIQGTHLDCDSVHDYAGNQNSSLDTEKVLTQTGLEVTCPETVLSSLVNVNHQEESSKVVEEIHTKAAKRMFAQALGLGNSNRLSQSNIERKSTQRTSIQQCDSQENHVDSIKTHGSKTPDLSTDSQISKHINASLCLKDQSLQSETGVAQDEQVPYKERPKVSTSSSLTARGHSGQHSKMSDIEQGRAAQRMLAHALGYRTLSIAISDRRRST